MSTLRETLITFLDSLLLAAQRLFALSLSILFIAGLPMVVGLAALTKKNRPKLAIRLASMLVFIILYTIDHRMARLQREFAGLRTQAAAYSMAWTQTARFIGPQREASFQRCLP